MLDRPHDLRRPVPRPLGPSRIEIVPDTRPVPRRSSGFARHAATERRCPTERRPRRGPAARDVLIAATGVGLLVAALTVAGRADRAAAPPAVAFATSVVPATPVPAAGRCRTTTRPEPAPRATSPAPAPSGTHPGASCARGQRVRKPGTARRGEPACGAAHDRGRERG